MKVLLLFFHVHNTVITLVAGYKRTGSYRALGIHHNVGRLKEWKDECLVIRNSFFKHKRICKQHESKDVPCHQRRSITMTSVYSETERVYTGNQQDGIRKTWECRQKTSWQTKVKQWKKINKKKGWQIEVKQWKKKI